MTDKQGTDLVAIVNGVKKQPLPVGFIIDSWLTSLESTYWIIFPMNSG
jgi:hypothetical protein